MVNSELKEYLPVTQEDTKTTEQALDIEEKETKSSKSSLWHSVVNLLSDIEGTGLLALPYIIDQGGISAIIALTIVPFICCYTGKVLIQSLYVTDKQEIKIRVSRNYKDIAESCWPRYGALIGFTPQVVQLTLLASLYLVLCGFLIEMGLLPDVPVIKQVWMAIFALIGFPTLFIKHLSKVAWLSLVSIIALGVAIVTILGYGISRYSRWDITRIALWDTTGTPFALATVVFSYTAHGALPTIEAHMKEPKQFNLMLSVTYAFTFIIKLSFAMLGYFAFSSNISEVITNSIPIQTLKIIVNSLLLVNTFFSYPFHVTIIINCIEDFMSDESGDPRFSKLSWCVSIRVIVTIISLLPAILIPHFALMMSFIGSLTCAFTVFIFPCVSHLFLCQDLPCSGKAIDCFVFGFGAMASITGLVVSVLKLVKSFQ